MYPRRVSLLLHFNITCLPFDRVFCFALFSASRCVEESDLVSHRLRYASIALDLLDVDLPPCQATFAVEACCGFGGCCTGGVLLPSTRSNRGEFTGS